MLAVSHRTNDVLPLNIWLTENSMSEATIKILSSDIELKDTIYKTLDISIKTFFSTIFKDYIATFFKILLFPILLAVFFACSAIYLVLTPIFIVYFNILNNRIIALKLDLNKRISNGSISVERLKNNHKNTLKILERLHITLEDKFKTEKLIKPSIFKMINSIKEIEQIERLAAYPENNQIVLSYDEMRELSLALKGFEPAEEQSDVYSY